jgi:hypothetical protein
LLNGVLAVVFALHLTVFATLFARRRWLPHLALCGTFVALAALYALKASAADPDLAGPLSLQHALRGLAVASTTTYVGLRLQSWRRERSLKQPRGAR